MTRPLTILLLALSTAMLAVAGVITATAWGNPDVWAE